MLKFIALNRAVKIYVFVSLTILVSSYSIKSIAQEKNNDLVFKVKAAFVLNIARFVSWPNIGNEEIRPILLCVYRSNPLGDALKSFQNKKISGREINTAQVNNLAEIGGCNILVVPDKELIKFESEAEMGFNLPVLTIADLTTQDPTGVAHRGIIVSLTRKKTSIGFEINLQQANDAGLRMSSDLLKLAKIVKGEN
ncbi:MAG: YfiR family protein [Cellvibrionaceae bacterium]